jgi:hypothetical protein
MLLNGVVIVMDSRLKLDKADKTNDLKVYVIQEKHSGQFAIILPQLQNCEF